MQYNINKVNEGIDHMINDIELLTEENELLKYALFALVEYIYDNSDNKNIKSKSVNVSEIIVDYNKRYSDISFGKKLIREVLK